MVPIIPLNITMQWSNLRKNSIIKTGKDIRKSLKDKLTGPWSTMAQRGTNNATLGGAPLTMVGVAGIGLQFKLNNRFNLALEDKLTFTNSDLVDGQQWQANYTPTAVINSIAQSKSADSYNFLSLGINFNIGKHAVEPLWWLNPLDYVRTRSILPVT